MSDWQKQGLGTFADILKSLAKFSTHRIAAGPGLAAFRADGSCVILMCISNGCRSYFFYGTL